MIALEPVKEFLANSVYLPGYMSLRGEEYSKNRGTFGFDFREPPVARGSIIHYVTPRGLHIAISQAGYALAENLAKEGLIGEYSSQVLRSILLQGRVKIIELDQRFRREIELGREVQGRFEIRRSRLSRRIPLLLEMFFEFDNRAVTGRVVSVIAPKPVTSLNKEVTRF